MCRAVNASGTPLTVHIIHRIAAFLLLGHLIGMFVSVRRRREPKLIRRAAGIALAAAVTQVMVAAVMIEMHFPAVLRSLHQAVGTLVWLAIVVTAIVTAHASRSAPAPELMGAAA